MTLRDNIAQMDNSFTNLIDSTVIIHALQEVIKICMRKSLKKETCIDSATLKKIAL